MKKESSYSKVTKNVEILPVLIRKPTLQQPKIEDYVSKPEVRDFLRDLGWLLVTLARLFAQFGLRRLALPTGLVIDEIKVRPRVYTGDIEVVDVKVSNPGTREETGNVTLTDATENVLIGRQTVTVPPGVSQMVRFKWETKGFRLGDHDLDAEAKPVGSGRSAHLVGREAGEQR